MALVFRSGTPPANAPTGEEALISLRSLNLGLLLALGVTHGASGCLPSEQSAPSDPGGGGAAETTGAAGMMAAAGTTGAGGTPGRGGTTDAGGTTGTAGAAGLPGAGPGGSDAGGAGPKEQSGAGGDGGAPVNWGAAGAATFTQVYNDVLSKYCAGNACHNPGKSGGVSVKTKTTAYARLSPLTIPGDPESSTFYDLLASDPPFMPPKDPLVPVDLVREIGRWIYAGAKNN